MLKVFNTLTRKKEIFRPREPGRVAFYQCGPTVYWTQHLGNLRAVVMGDVVRRTLTYLGYDVAYVRNYTDVGHLVSDEDMGEDKITKGAKREGLSPEEISDKYIAQFERDTAALNLLPPTAKPRATETLPEIIAMVETLIKKGYAYETPLAVYFDTTKAKNYTRLSGQKMESLEPGAGAGRVDDPEKRERQDFALWFFKAGEHSGALQTWRSPFHSPLVQNGEGFPGWHIECSAMAKKYLGETLDFHMGGVEHVPIHHTNEIAQSEAANSAPLSRYWLHNEHLMTAGEKMAKSAGTSYVLDDVVGHGYDSLTLRYFFLQAHYRSKQNFTWEALGAAARGLTRLREKIASLPITTGSDQGPDREFRARFREALEDDFNTPAAMAVLEESLKKKVGQKTVFAADQVLGLKLDIEAKTEREPVPQNILDLVKERGTARREENWSGADRLRKKIEAEGYEIKDTPSGPIVVKKK